MLWWMSFALDDNVTSYVCIVEADSFKGAYRRTRELGLRPGGEVLGFPIPKGSEEESLPRDRFLTDDELRWSQAFDEPETDYAGLGYQETRAWRLALYDLDILAFQSTTWRDLFLTLCREPATDNE